MIDFLDNLELTLLNALWLDQITAEEYWEEVLRSVSIEVRRLRGF